MKIIWKSMYYNLSNDLILFIFWIFWSIKKKYDIKYGIKYDI